MTQRTTIMAPADLSCERIIMTPIQGFRIQFENGEIGELGSPIASHNFRPKSRSAPRTGIFTQLLRRPPQFSQPNWPMTP